MLTNGGFGQHHHAITTNSPEAQRFFDQGLTLVYAFNHEEAIRTFRRASELDLRPGMAFWGIALAVGPCINLDVDPPINASDPRLRPLSVLMKCGFFSFFASAVIEQIRMLARL